MENCFLAVSIVVWNAVAGMNCVNYSLLRALTNTILDNVHCLTYIWGVHRAFRDLTVLSYAGGWNTNWNVEYVHRDARNVTNEPELTNLEIIWKLVLNFESYGMMMMMMICFL